MALCGCGWWGRSGPSAAGSAAMASADWPAQRCWLQPGMHACGWLAVAPATKQARQVPRAPRSHLWHLHHVALLVQAHKLNLDAAAHRAPRLLQEEGRPPGRGRGAGCTSGRQAMGGWQAGRPRAAGGVGGQVWKGASKRSPGPFNKRPHHLGHTTQASRQAPAGSLSGPAPPGRCPPPPHRKPRPRPAAIVLNKAAIFKHFWSKAILGRKLQLRPMQAGGRSAGRSAGGAAGRWLALPAGRPRPSRHLPPAAASMPTVHSPPPPFLPGAPLQAPPARSAQPPPSRSLPAAMMSGRAKAKVGKCSKGRWCRWHSSSSAPPL